MAPSESAVLINFDCLPFRCVGDIGLPVDAPDEHRALWKRFRTAMDKHGPNNTYFVYNADCVFRLSNDDNGAIRYVFEATMKTNPEDEKPVSVDLICRLAESDFGHELTPPVQDFFEKAVCRAVMAEFQSYIDAGNLQKALEEKEQLLRAWNENRGFVGMDI